MKKPLRGVLGIGLGALLVGVTAGAGPRESATATVDTGQVAATIVNQTAGIRRGELVLIEGGTRDLKLLEDLAVEVRKLGAHPLIVIGSDRLDRRMFMDVDKRFDSQEPKFAAQLAETIDAMITVDYMQKPDNLADIPMTRRAARAEVFEKIGATMRDRGVVQVHLGNDLYPTQALAEQFAIPYDKLAEIFWAGVNTNYDRLQVIGANVKDALSKGKQLRITAPNGTDLTVEIMGRPIFVSDGVVSSEDRYERGPAAQVWLPAGEVYLTPVPKTAEGTFVAETFFYEGNRVDGLTLKFKKGKLTSMTADSDITALRAAYNAAPSDRDWFGAIDIGINPDVKLPRGARVATWIASGTISMGIGSNTWAGGDNDVAYGLYAHLLKATLTVDNTKLVDTGRLLVQ